MKNTLTHLSYEILKIANREIPRSIFLKEISILLLDWFKCDELNFLLKMPKSKSKFELVHYSNHDFDYNIIQFEDMLMHLPGEESVNLWQSILHNNFDTSSSFFSEKGTFWTINFGNISLPYRIQLRSVTTQNISESDNDYSLLISPFLYNNERVGLVQLKNIKPELFSSLGIELFEEFSQTLSVILYNQYTQALLSERVKELAFLYQMSKITKQKSISLKEIILQIIELIPPAWQYPEITTARITINGELYSNKPITNCAHKIESNITVNNKKCGIIEIIYTEKCPNIDEGPFFYEERSLLNNIAEELATIISQKDNEKEI